MKNNKGIGNFELLTILVFGIALIALLLWFILGNANKEKYNTMRKSAASLSQSLAANMDSFHNTNIAYLKEAIDEGLMNPVKSPFSGKDCSVSESKVEIEDGKILITLRCDNYLIDRTHIGGSYDDIAIYKVSDWKEQAPKGKYEEKVLYNCLDGGKEKYSEYNEEMYFVGLINNDYGSEHFKADTINNECKVVKKTFYRNKLRVK